MNTPKAREVPAAQMGTGEKVVYVVIDTSQHPAAKTPVSRRFNIFRRVHRKPSRVSMPHNIDAAPPSISEIWGETLTFGVAAAALFAVISLASVFFFAMQIFSAGNTHTIIQQAQERLEQTP